VQLQNIQELKASDFTAMTDYHGQENV